MQNIYHPRFYVHLLRVFIHFLIAFILFLRSMKFSYLCKVINNVGMNFYLIFEVVIS